MLNTSLETDDTCMIVALNNIVYLNLHVFEYWFSFSIKLVNFQSSEVLQNYLLWAVAMHFDGALNIGPNHRTWKKKSRLLDIFFQVCNFKICVVQGTMVIFNMQHRFFKVKPKYRVNMYPRWSTDQQNHLRIIILTWIYYLTTQSYKSNLLRVFIGK